MAPTKTRAHKAANLVDFSQPTKAEVNQAIATNLFPSDNSSLPAVTPNKDFTDNTSTFKAASNSGAPSNVQTTKDVPTKAGKDKSKYSRNIKELKTNIHAKAHTTSNMQGVFHRMCYWRTKTGEAVFVAKLPMRNDKAAYTNPQERFISGDITLMNKFKIHRFCTLKAEGSEQALADGRQGVWKAGVYIHSDPTNNTDVWAARWASNWAKLYHQLSMPDRGLSRYENRYAPVCMQDETMVNTCHLGDLLITQDVLEIMDVTFSDDTLHSLMEDDDIVADYFGTDRVIHARVMYNELYGETQGNVTVHPGMANDPAYMIDGFEEV